MRKQKNNERVENYIIVLVIGTLVMTGMSAFALVATNPSYAETTVPGHSGARYDGDDNGYPDAGKAVNGKYVSVYSYDESGGWYWDLGDGRVQGTVESANELDQTTLTKCTYQVQHRGMFQNDPFLDSGWIKNEINCVGKESGTYNYTIVSESDPRYTGNPDRAVWGNWEYQRETESGTGNLLRPERHVGR